jgi:hypothetical protein
MKRSALTARADVVLDGAREEEDVLEDEPQMAPERPEVVLADVAAVDPHRAAHGIVEPHQQVDDRGLSGAGQSDDREALPGVDAE